MRLQTLSPSLGEAPSPEGLQGFKAHLPLATKAALHNFHSHHLSSVELIHLSSSLAGVCCTQLFPRTCPGLHQLSCMLGIIVGQFILPHAEVAHRACCPQDRSPPSTIYCKESILSYITEHWHALPPQCKTGSWGRVLIFSFILAGGTFLLTEICHQDIKRVVFLHNVKLILHCSVNLGFSMQNAWVCSWKLKKNPKLSSQTREN